MEGLSALQAENQTLQEQLAAAHKRIEELEKDATTGVRESVKAVNLTLILIVSILSEKASGFIFSILERVREAFSSSLKLSALLFGSFSSSGEPFHHEQNHDETDHTFATPRRIFIVSTHTAIAAQPGEGALNNPVTLPPKVVFRL